MYITTAIAATTSIFSYLGIKNDVFQRKYAFNINNIIKNNQYYRFFTSGFLHTNWMHLIINLLAFITFGSGLETALGGLYLFIIYASSLLGGNILAFFIHRHNPFFTSVGASGAISGLVFATIAFQPSLSFLFIPNWLFGVLYVVYTVYAIRSNRTDIGHAAHLGGALIGMLVCIALNPSLIEQNWLPILLILIPGSTVIFIMIQKPEWILISKQSQKEYATTYEDRYNMTKNEQKQKVDEILEKINSHGMESLTKKERQILDDYAKS